MARKSRRWSRSFRSLRGRMLGLSIPIAALSFGILSFLIDLAHRSRLREDLRSEIDHTALVGSHFLAAPMWYVNSQSLLSGLEMLLEHDAVTAVIAQDAEGAILAWAAETESGVRSDFGAWPEEIDVSGWQRLSRQMVFEQVGTRQPTGRLEVFFSEERARWRMEVQRRFHLGLFALLISALVAGILIATRRAIFIPIERFRETLAASRGRDLQSVEWTSADEIGELIRLYNECVFEERRTKAEIRGHLRNLDGAFESLRHGLAIFDRDFCLTAFNRRFLEILDHEEGLIRKGTSLKSLLRANAAKGEYGAANVDAVIIDRLAIAASNEYFRRERERSDGTTLLVESSPMPDGGFVSIYTDITEQKALESQLRLMTLTDTLTGLPHRALFHDRLRQALALADRIGTRLAVHLVDLDHFRGLNEEHGREVGDEILRELGGRLRHIVRKSDTLARLEADRFAVIQQYVPSADEAALFAHRILGSLSRPFEVTSGALRITASIGITVYPDDDQISSHILKNAHLALTAAKAEGRQGSRFFSPEIGRGVEERGRLEEEIFKGLRDEQFVLYYEPRICLETGALTAVCAHLFWQHPERGLVGSEQFRAVAEERGLIVPLNEWMMTEGCRQRALWQQRTNSTWKVAVPLAQKYFEETDVLQSIRSILERFAVDRRLLAVEVNVSTLLWAPDAVAQDLHALRTQGVTAVLGGLGREIAQVRSLRQLPIDVIKLDWGEIRDFEEDAEVADIINAAAGLRQELGLRLAATGVGKEEPRDRLRDLGLDEIEGEAVSPPLGGEDFIRWLAGSSRD